MNRVSQASPVWLNKVPEVTLTFWLIKMMSTTVGETAADFLNVNLGFGLTGTSAVMGVLLAVFLGLQVSARRYIPWRYWSTVVFVSVFGTLVTDNLSDNLGVPLAASTLAFSAALLLTFGIWYAKERTLSIHSIDTIKRELFYWTAILLTFALGTAAGDWVAEGLNLGYANSALVFGALIGLAAIARFVFHRSAVTTFWVAYVLTRPFGASCGDLLSQPSSNGGLGLGVVDTSAGFVAAIVVLVLYLSISERAVARQQT
ncbi:hypothetical protein OYT13_11205 [Pandoraea sp. XJJ-1]|uniref:Membrane-anchored protein n=1 Tax=Pandoraea cepalis TaxID=2508294 RepID=A0AAW7MIZ7_9BURK|nr:MULTISPECIES: hypothetical protein [Pandoraea]MDN4572727.1 hypothetical protein [Pandoraea cepalis]MDN4576593.1 hypothetical protein [Pandoraea cepalis]WAL84922.1 hypothetical protein OYT13_11205 [Pandoraea sp. XJJ-1]